MANQSLFGQRDSGAQERFKFPIAEFLKIYAQSASSILQRLSTRKKGTGGATPLINFFMIRT